MELESLLPLLFRTFGLDGWSWLLQYAMGSFAFQKATVVVAWGDALPYLLRDLLGRFRGVPSFTSTKVTHTQG